MNEGTLSWLWKVPGRKKGWILALIIVQALHGASGVLYALFLRNAVDAATRGEHDGFWHAMACFALLIAAQLALRAVIRWLLELSRAGLENLFRERLLGALLAGDYQRMNAVHSGEWMNRLTNDATVVANGYAEIVPGLAGMAVKLASALVMVALLQPRFAAVLIPCGLLLILFTWLFRKVLKKLHKGVQEADGRARIFLQERIGNMLMIRSFAVEKNTLSETRERLEDHKAARMRRNRFSNLCNIGFGTAMNGMYLFGAGWCGYGILTGTVTFGTMTAVTQLISQIQAPFANISGYLPRWYAMQASAERLMEAEGFAGDGEWVDAMTPAQAREFYDGELAAFGLRDASYTYYPASEGAEGLNKEGMPVVLEGVTMEIKKGEFVAFTGRSGCGKSTVLRLLTCVYGPDGGERYWRGTDGREGALTAAHRRLFAYVPQGNALMSGTIREVVSFAEPGESGNEERIRQALRVSCADGFVSELEDGLDTVLGERGTGLSEGQMQRLSVARAVFSGAPVLLLDEATSALDGPTEERLLGNLRELRDRTVIIVTHRPAAVEACDRVIEFGDKGLEDGEKRK